MPTLPSIQENRPSQDAGRTRKGALDERDDSLLILRGGVRGKKFVGLRVEVRPVLFGLVASILVALAGWLYLEQASRVIAQAHEILLLEQEKENLTHEIVSLQAEIARLGALQRILREGEHIQYRLPEAGDRTQRLYLDLAPQASAPALPAVSEAPPTVAPQKPAGTWPERVSRWLGSLWGR